MLCCWCRWRTAVTRAWVLPTPVWPRISKQPGSRVVLRRRLTDDGRDCSAHLRLNGRHVKQFLVGGARKRRHRGKYAMKFRAPESLQYVGRDADPSGVISPHPPTCGVTNCPHLPRRNSGPAQKRSHCRYFPRSNPHTHSLTIKWRSSRPSGVRDRSRTVGSSAPAMS